MTTPKKLQQTSYAILIAASIVTLVVMEFLPAPFGGVGTRVTFLIEVFLLSIAGPLNYPFLWSGSEFTAVTAITFVGFSVIPAGLYFLWYTKKQSIAILGMAAFLWTGFGGFSTLMGIAAGV